MIIFLDTSIVIGENYLRSSIASSLLKSSRFLGLRLSIPQIVLDETSGQFRLALENKHEQFCKLREDINKLAGKGLITDTNFLEEQVLFSSWFEEILRNYGVEILPYPELRPEEIVRASYERKKPFKENGAGFKDYLLWNSIASEINELSEGTIEIYFLTNNVKDFCEKKDREWVLHAHLVEGIRNQGKMVTVYTGLRDFFGERISPLLERIDPAYIPEFNLGNLLARAREEVEEYLSSYSAYGIEGLQFENEVTIDAVHSVAIEDWEIKKVEVGEYLIMLSGSVEIEASGFIEKFDLYMREHKDLFVIDRDWNEWVAAVSQTIETPISLALSYSKSSGETIIHSIELDNEYSH